MNESAIVKHWQALYKDGKSPYLAARTADSYLVTDGRIALRLPPEHLLFDSRRVFPEFPDDCETLKYHPGQEPEQAESSLITAFSLWATDATAQKAIATDWLRGHANSLYRAFELADGKRIFVNEDFVTLINGKNDSLDLYQFFGHPLPEDDGKAGRPIIAHLDGEAVAALMPMRIMEQAPLFAIGAEHGHAPVFSGEVLKAAEALRPKPGDGIDSVTISDNRGRSATLDANTRSKVKQHESVNARS